VPCTQISANRQDMSLAQFFAAHARLSRHFGCARGAVARDYSTDKFNFPACMQCMSFSGRAKKGAILFVPFRFVRVRGIRCIQIYPDVEMTVCFCLRKCYFSRSTFLLVICHCSQMIYSVCGAKQVFYFFCA
jgi:hypothetical protein